MPNPKIAICVPSKYGLRTRTKVLKVWKPWFDAFLAQLNHPYKVFEGHDQTNHVAIIRERILNEVLDDNTCTHMLWLDDDVIPPMNCVNIFLASKRRVSCGIYWNRGDVRNPNEMTYPLLQKNDGELIAYEFFKYETAPIFRTLKTGFGCFWMTVSMMDYIARPYFVLEDARGFGEDAFFCSLLNIAGREHANFEIWANAKILCKHLISSRGQIVQVPKDEVLEDVHAKYNT